MSKPSTRRTGWSVQIARVLGIPIRIHFTFVLILVYVGYFAASQGSNVPRSIVSVLLVFACVVLHELGHAAMARKFGVRTREIVLYPIGGIARLENMPGGKAELLIAIAGPAVNFVLAGLALVALVFLGLAGIGLPDNPLIMSTLPDLVATLLFANVLLFAFNLLPAFPMDGGRILRSALALRMREDKATNIAATIGQGMAILMGAAGLFWLHHPWLLLIALFVFLGASQEAMFTQRRVQVHGHTAGDAMITRFETLAPQDSLEQASAALLNTHQQDFPVVDAWDRVAGMLSRTALLGGLAQHGKTAAVLDVMDRSVTIVRPDTPLETILLHLQKNPSKPVLVKNESGLVGMITLDNLVEFIEVARRAEGARDKQEKKSTAD
jgi:Zn-dependent protease/predicted transcriptional regulator